MQSAKLAAESTGWFFKPLKPTISSWGFKCLTAAVVQHSLQNNTQQCYELNLKCLLKHFKKLQKNYQILKDSRNGPDYGLNINM